MHKSICIFISLTSFFICSLDFASALPQNAVISISVERSLNNPLISHESSIYLDPQSAIGGPSVIKVPSWIVNPLGAYYMYFSTHRGDVIRLAYADSLHGPWTVYEPGTLQLSQAVSFEDHIASPDVHVDDENQQIRMYFHGVIKNAGGQGSGVALSDEGLTFTASQEILGKPYFRVFSWGNYYYALSKKDQTGWSELYRSRDGLTSFENRGNFIDGNPRHFAVNIIGDQLLVFYSRVGDAPEKIVMATVELTDNWQDWIQSEVIEVIEPELDYEGINYPNTPSTHGMAINVRQLRDPYVYEENGEYYLFYSVAGETGIAMAALGIEGICIPPGSISIMHGQTLAGHTINITSIVISNGATNVSYTVTEDLRICDIDPSGTFIEAENFTGTIHQGTAFFIPENDQSDSLGTGYLKSNGGSGGLCPPAHEGKEYEVQFTETGTYTAWIRGFAFDGKSNSVFIGLDGQCLGAIKESRGSFNQWTWTTDIVNGANTFNVTDTGIHKINIWVREANHLTDAIYVTKGDETPTDTNHGYEIHPDNCIDVLFTGSSAEAQSVDTSGWKYGNKPIGTDGYDLVCGSRLATAYSTFYFNNDPAITCNDNDGDGYGNPASVDCTYTDFDCNDVNSETVECHPSDADISGCIESVELQNYIDLWLSGEPGITVDLINEALHLHTVCCELLGCDMLQEESCFDSVDNDVDGLSDCADPDCDGQSNGGCFTGLSGICSQGSLICAGGAEMCVQDNQPQPETYNLTPSCSDQIDNDCDGFIDTDPECEGPGCEIPIIESSGTYIPAEGFTGTINQGTATFLVENAQSEFLGNNYLKSNGLSGGICPSSGEGKEFEVEFTETGIYNVWIRGYAFDGKSNSVFIGIDGECVGAIKEPRGSFNQWVWTNSLNNGVHMLNVLDAGLHKINIWVRENNHLTDGIYITKSSETPDDQHHGTVIDFCL